MYVVAADKKRTVRELKAGADRGRRAAARHRRGPRGRGHRLAPAARCCSPRSRCAGWSSTRSPRTPSSEAAQTTRDLDQRPRRRPGDPPHHRPAVRLRGLAGALAEGAPGLSAGRVQSVATRLLVERERERIAFRSAGVLGRQRHVRAAGGSFTGQLVAVDGARVASGKDFDDDRRLRRPSGGSCCLDEAAARSLVEALDGPAVHGRRRSSEKPPTRRPSAPFMTSTLQQEAARKLRWAAQRDDARRPAALRERPHHLHAHRLDDAVGPGPRRRPRAGRRAVRRRPRARAPAPLRPQGQERPGGPRGHPPGRRLVPHARRGRRAAGPRRVRAVRTDLEAHAGLADGRRPAGHHDRAPGGAGRRRPGRGVQRLRHRDRVRRVPRGLRGGHRRGPRRRPRVGRASDRRLPAMREGEAVQARDLVAEGHATSRRPGTRRRRWSRTSRSAGSVGPRRTPRSSPRSSTGGTCARRARR